MRIAGVLGIAMLAFVLLTSATNAQYFKKPISDLDPTIMQIDEKKFLGARLDGETPLVDMDGTDFTLGDMLGQPLILVLAYYTCDGSCSVINTELLARLREIERVRAGTDYRVLTLSFDANDTLDNTRDFAAELGIGEELAAHWRLATFKNRDDLEAQTSKIGFKFFWSPEDKLFLHPGAFLFLSPEGRLIRILYPPEAEAQDVELAVLDARQGQFRPQEIINFAVSLCYSYNFEEGKYMLSIPIFVGFGALFVGLTTLVVSIAVFKNKRRRLREDLDHAQRA